MNNFPDALYVGQVAQILKACEWRRLLQETIQGEAERFEGRSLESFKEEVTIQGLNKMLKGGYYGPHLTRRFLPGGQAATACWTKIEKRLDPLKKSRWKPYSRTGLWKARILGSQNTPRN